MLIVLTWEKAMRCEPWRKQAKRHERPGKDLRLPLGGAEHDQAYTSTNVLKILDAMVRQGQACERDRWGTAEFATEFCTRHKSWRNRGPQRSDLRFTKMREKVNYSILEEMSAFSDSSHTPREIPLAMLKKRRSVVSLWTSK